MANFETVEVTTDLSDRCGGGMSRLRRGCWKLLIGARKTV